MQSAEIERDAVCTALKPDQITREAYDNSPPMIQEWVTDTVLTWIEVCDG